MAGCSAFRGGICMLSVLAALALAPLRAACQQATSAAQPPRVEVLIDKTVVFIRQTAEADGGLTYTQGTGFWVSVPDKRLGPNGFFGYLVTNRHVAQAIESVGGVCQQYRVIQTSLTSNSLLAENGDREHILTYPNPPGLPWVFPANPSIDLAVLPLAPDPRKYDVEYVGLSDFISQAQLGRNFGLGDRILFAGLFAPFEGAGEIQPILRQGMLSMLPDSPIVTTLCKPGDVYLADVHAIRGNSGSPVFMSPRGFAGGWLYEPSNGALGYALLGVISGYEFESEDMTLHASTATLQGSVQANSGISVIVPADQLRDLLESAPLQKLRDEAVAHRPRE